jgi:DNA-directed RNA polymerase specialized sigma24 family protein
MSTSLLLPPASRNATAPRSPASSAARPRIAWCNCRTYRARDAALDRPVALKTLRPRHAGSPAALARFVSEAAVTGRLHHPGVPPVHAVGTLPDGRPFLAMKLIEGRTLHELLREQGHSPARWLAAFEVVCQAVGYAHSQGFIHRDLQLGNIMVGAFGEVQVMDWGLAKTLAGPGRRIGAGPGRAACTAGGGRRRFRGRERLAERRAPGRRVRLVGKTGRVRGRARLRPRPTATSIFLRGSTLARRPGGRADWRTEGRGCYLQRQGKPVTITSIPSRTSRDRPNRGGRERPRRRLAAQIPSAKEREAMPSGGNVTHWLRLLRAGEREVVQQLWQRYHRSLVVLARQKLGDLPRAAADEEDVALSAFDSFIRRAQGGRFPQLEDRHDLWQLLIVITTRKARDLAEHEGRDKRDWRRVQAEADGEEDGALIRSLIGREPDPAFAAQVAEECQRLMALLPDPDLRRVALFKLEGHTNEEIAAQVERSLATVERWLNLIRKHWAGVAKV